MSELTIGEICEFLLPGVSTPGSTDYLDWPPDIYAVCISLARFLSAYRTWTEKSAKDIYGDVDINELAYAWRNYASKVEEHRRLKRAKPRGRLSQPPGLVRESWDCILKRLNDPIGIARKDLNLIYSVLRLISLADIVAKDLGYSAKTSRGMFELQADMLLFDTSTLCYRVHPDRARVLPKSHAPKTGLNVRSLTHNLSVCSAGDVNAVWNRAPEPRKETFSLLLAPWPLTIDASQFQAGEDSQILPSQFGLVDFRHRHAAVSVVEWLHTICQNARKIGQQIDMIVFPEVALSMDEWTKVKYYRDRELPGAALLAGVIFRASNKKRSVRNELRFSYSNRVLLSELLPDIVQSKHHRWKLDESQIKTYSLGGTLATKKEWWENIEIPERDINFICLSPQLSICPLICEDLARQDPVAEIVRAIGPSLVIALLMDGPQLSDRWAARYATVLADDPGYSVLTFTSLGMIRRSTPPRDKKPSSGIGLWKDGFGAVNYLELEGSSQGILLNLQFKERKQWTADAREKEVFVPILVGVHQLEGPKVS
ncbi:MAG: hypothetical protein JWN73_247 [Betaproteobacteria bacterium]|nr:hypothetical protein [Betaproteobacteria bacterium]